MDPKDLSEAPPDGVAGALGPGEGRELARLGGGYHLTYADTRRTLDVHAPDGRICVRLTLGPEGPQIEVRGASLAIVAEREVALRCQRLEIDAAEGLALRSGGDLSIAAAGALATEAREQRLVARRGDFAVIANDDVQVDGERILLNSPIPPVGR